jgi:hypothetical protein
MFDETGSWWRCAADRGAPWRKNVLTFHPSGDQTAAPRRTLHLALTRQVAA